MKAYVFIFLCVMAVGFSGCSGRFWGGAAAGAAGAGAAYEYSAHREMKKLEDDYEAGRIDKEEYESRKKQIEKQSILK